jgi:cell division transport system permease protein
VQEAILEMSRVLRHLREGVVGVFRHFALAFSSISSVTITLVLLGLFLLLNQNIGKITVQIEESVALYAQIEPETTGEAIDTLVTKVKETPGVLHVQYSDKHQELEDFIEKRGEEGEALFGQFRGDENPFLDALIINIKSGYDVKPVMESVTGLEGIYKVSIGSESIQQLMDTMQTFRNAGLVFVVVLGGIAIFLISNTIGATIHSRDEEIAIMRTVGATNWYIRWPFIIEGMIIGLLGSIIPILIVVIGYEKFYTAQFEGLGSMFSLVPVNPLVWEVSGTLLLLGVLVGALGSLITVSRRLRWTR